MEAWIITGGAVLAALISAFGAISVAKLNQIHRLTNSTAKAMQEQNTRLHTKVNDLERIINEMRNPEGDA